MNRFSLVFAIVFPVFSALQAQDTAVTAPGLADAARYLAGLPVSEGSPLAHLMHNPRWEAHAAAMNAAFAALEQRQLGNIRSWRQDLLAPTTQGRGTCLYLFSGPDFLYADAFYPDCTTYLLQGLEPADLLPELTAVPEAALSNTLQNIEASLNTILHFSFFKTKNLREDLQRSELKGTVPIMFVFLARSGKEVTGLEQVSVDQEGHVANGATGSIRGVRISFTDSAAGARKTLYYFTGDLSDDALKRNPGLVRFYGSFGPTNSFLKAASYLMHEGGFSSVRNFVLATSDTILQDDSGIPIRDLPFDRWILRFFGAYPGPIHLFAKFDQPALRQDYAASAPKPLPFGFGYQWNRQNSTLMLAVRR
ncbi:MAG TPA: hypothetical protein VGD78_06840 [Chthoniobacterales bacterium]